MRYATLLFLLYCASIVNISDAAVIHEAVGATLISGTQNGSSGGLATIHNQAGLQQNYISGVTDFDSFVVNTNANYGGGSSTFGFPAIPEPGESTIVVDFDLGETLPLNGFALWNSVFNQSQSVSRFDLQLSNDPSFAVGVADVLSDALPSLPATNNIGVGETFSFATTSAQYARFTIEANFNGDDATLNGQIGVSEVAFSASAVPEPSAFAVLCLGGMGYVGMRRRKRIAAAERLITS